MIRPSSPFTFSLTFLSYLRPRPRPLMTPSARRFTSSEMFMSRIFWARVLAACLSVAVIRPARSTVARAASVFRALVLDEFQEPVDGLLAGQSAQRGDRLPLLVVAPGMIQRGQTERDPLVHRSRLAGADHIATRL